MGQVSASDVTFSPNYSMPPPNYYKVLEIERSATQDQIQKAYRNLALKA